METIDFKMSDGDSDFIQIRPKQLQTNPISVIPGFALYICPYQKEIGILWLTIVVVGKVWTKTSMLKIDFLDLVMYEWHYVIQKKSLESDIFSSFVW